MSITQEGFAFGSPTTYLEPQIGPPELDLQVNRFPGVVGESHIISPRRGREIAVPGVTLESATEAGLLTLIYALDLKVGSLTGTLTINSANYRDCTFLGFFLEERFYDPASAKYVAFGTLRWRQRKISDPSTS